MPEPTVHAVVPAHKAARELASCLDHLFQAGFASREILVVDDGSRDATGDVARAAGVRVLVNERPERPARARNIGVEAVSADVIVFVDADVLVHPGARARIIQHFQDDPSLDAVFGSYDDAPAGGTVVSDYRNLLHHYVHQHSRTEGSTFWTGFGVVRRTSFVRLGGLRSEWENIEDVEFGLRLAQSGGKIRLDPSLLAKHLKVWTVRSMFLVDLKGRAIPWTRLILFHGGPKMDLNVSASHRVSAAALTLALACVPATVLDARFAAGALAAFATFIAANFGFFRFLSRRRGLGFVLRAVPFHALHTMAAVIGYGAVLVTELPRHWLAGRGAGRSAR